MNKKLIAAAVSAAVVAPVAAYGETTVYGSIRNAIDINDLNATPASGVDADSVTDITGVSSRFGIKYSQSMGNGLTASGQYEFSAGTDNESGIGDGRVAKVGISGAFGSIDVGNQWSSYFNAVGTLVSPTYSLGAYIYSGVAGGPLRTSNTIKYANSYGPLSLQLDVRFNGSNESGDDAEKLAGDGIGLGLSFAVNDNLTIAAAFDNETGGDRAAVDAVTGSLALVTPAYNGAGGTKKKRDGELVNRVDVAGERVDTAVLIPVVMTDDSTADAAAGRVIEKAVTAAAAKPADESPDTDRVGIAAKYAFGGGYWASLGWQNYQVDDDERTAKDDGEDIDAIILFVGGNFSEKTNWMVGYSVADSATDGTPAKAEVTEVTTPGALVAGENAVAAVPGNDDATQLTWGIYHKLGGGMRLFYEATAFENGIPAGTKGHNEGARHLLGMRVNF